MITNTSYTSEGDKFTPLPVKGRLHIYILVLNSNKHQNADYTVLKIVRIDKNIEYV